MKKGYTVALEEETVGNTNFRKVLYTGAYSQLVLMALKPREDIGLEVHHETDQFFRFESGEGKVVVNETTYEVTDGDAVIIPAGSEHNVLNTSATETLTLYTIYSPAHHKDGVIHASKEDAIADEESGNDEFDGVTTE
jgi:mannose-6-phosphate isomerase-like protein (cupin superfamily)